MNSNIKTGIYYDNSRNKYVVSYNKMDNATEKKQRIRKSFNTEEEAKQYKQELEYKSGNIIFIKNNGIPICELMKFIEEEKFKTNRIGEQQYGKNFRTISKIEQLAIGKKDVSDITSEELQSYFNSLTHYSKSYMEQFITKFSQAFRYSLAKGYIHRNPMIDTYIPESKKTAKKIRALEIEEQQILTEYLKNVSIEDEKYKNVFLIQMYEGLRIGEVLALQNKDIDLEKNVIHISKTLTRDKNGKVIMGNNTKTFAGVRDVPIQDIILKDIKEQLNKSKDNFNEQLFVSSENYYADPKGLNKILKRIVVEQLHVNDISTHSLRHTFGTRCIEAGMAPVVVQRLMGHNDIRVTLNTYTSVLQRFKEDELKKLTNYYQNQNISYTNDYTQDNSR